MHSLKYLFLNIFFCTLALSAQAQTVQSFEVPFVPTPPVVVDEMLRLAGVTSQDYVMDLGSGDGRVLITAAAKFGARGQGVELDADLVAQSRESAVEAGVAERVSFLQQDLFKTDFSKATVITLYLQPVVMAKLHPMLQNLRPGTRLVSHDFRLGDWKPDAVTQIRKNSFLWIVPAKVAGHWQIALKLPGGEHQIRLELRQKYQEVDVYARFDSRIAQVWETRLRGDRLQFVIVDDRDREAEASLYFEGRVNGDVIEGEMRRGVGSSQTVQPWRAVRVAKP